MGRRPHAQRLHLRINGTPVGCWEVASSRHTLTYLDEWVHHPQGRPLSLSLPFKPGNAPYSGPLVQHYFENLLPDSDAIRRRIAQHYQTGGTEAHQLLAAIGRDCVGALQLLPEDAETDTLFSIQGEALDEAACARLLRAAVSDAPLGQRDTEAELRLSIAGAQEKSALLWHQGQWHKPLGSTPTTHILKLPMGRVGAMQADMRTSVENEWLCSRIIAAFDLPIAACSIAQFEDIKALVVTRFDRRPANDGSWIVRLPQEDFCQATGTSPLRKYQADGGPGISAIMQILMGSDDPQGDRVRFFKTQLLFWLLAATDGHAKNFSLFLQPGNHLRATPLYDVLSAHPIIGTGAHQLAPHKAKLAMAVRGSQNHYLIDQVQRRHWAQHAQACGLGDQVAQAIIEDVLARVDTVVEQMMASLPTDFPMDLADAILHGLTRQAERLRRMPN